MRIFWWQDGIHLSAESEEEHQALAKCWDALQLFEKFEIVAGDGIPSLKVNSVQTDNE